MSEKLEYLYRFRPLKRVVDDGELERQQLYFATLQELNDPMEGYLNLFWQGDRIVWCNLFRQYLLCLDKVLQIIALGGTPDPVSSKDLDVFSGITDLPTDAYKRRVGDIYSRFFADPQVTRLIDYLAESGRKVRASELSFYLTLIHIPAIRLITSLDRSNSGVPSKAKESAQTFLEEGYVEAITQLHQEHNDGVAVLFDVARGVSEEGALLASYNRRGLGTAHQVVIDFPRMYVEKLETLIYPPWYMTCFMADCTNSAAWAHYADSHKGIALKFKVSTDANGRQGLMVGNDVIGHAATKGGPTKKLRGERFMLLDRVQYTNTYPDVDFFRSLGRLPWPRLVATWHSDADGNYSTVLESIRGDEKAWHKLHWETLSRLSCTKLTAWEYEKEYRLVRVAMLDELREKPDRQLTFRFSDLDGIVFGIRTPTESKHQLMDIVERKCKQERRADFRFYQAAYNSRDGSIEVRHLRLLKVKP